MPSSSQSDAALIRMMKSGKDSDVEDPPKPDPVVDLNSFAGTPYPGDEGTIPGPKIDSDDSGCFSRGPVDFPSELFENLTGDRSGSGAGLEAEIGTTTEQQQMLGQEPMGSSHSPASQRQINNEGKERIVDTSCAKCQSKKTKCNGSKPCKDCLEAGSECIYSVLGERRNLHDSIPEVTSDRMVSTESPELPSKRDRWAEIRKKAQDRAALLASQRETPLQSEERSQIRERPADDRNPETNNKNEESSEEESIEVRVARIKARVAELTSDIPVEQQESTPQNDKNGQGSHKQNATRKDRESSGEEPIEARVERTKVRVAELTGTEDAGIDSRVDSRVDGIRKKNARFDIPAERNLANIDQLISEATDEEEIKELKQQKRLLRNRQAALDSRHRKNENVAKVPHFEANDILESSALENVATHLNEGSNIPLASDPLEVPPQSADTNADPSDLSLSPDPDAQVVMNQETEQEAVYNISRPQSQYLTPVAGDTDTLPSGDYPDDGFGYTNPRELVQFDLNHTTQPRGRKDIFEGDRTQRRSSADPTERGPPPTTRGFDKISSNEKEELGDRDQNSNRQHGDSSGEETIESRVSRIKVRVAELTGNKNENTPSWADFISKQQPPSPSRNKLGPIYHPKKDFSDDGEVDNIPPPRRKVNVGSSGHSRTRPIAPQSVSSTWGTSFPELGFGDASTSEPSHVRLESKERDNYSGIIDHKKEHFDRELAHAKGENNKLGTKLADKKKEFAETQREQKGNLRTPKAKFTEDPNPIRKGVAPLEDVNKGDVPPGARWTKISRKLVNPEALERGKERYEARDEFVIVLRVLSRDEVQDYAEATEKIRAARGEAGEKKNRNDGRTERKKISERPEFGANDEIQANFTLKTDPSKISSLSNNFEQLSREFERERQEGHGQHSAESPTTRHRHLFSLPGDLTDLEKQLHRLDHTDTLSQGTETHTSHRRSAVTGGEQNKQEILGEIHPKFSQYPQALDLLNFARSVSPANMNEVTSYRNYLANSASEESPTQPLTTTSTKPRLGREEVDTLEQEFKTNPKPTTQQKLAFSTAMDVDLARINNWFQNRRAKVKQEKKQAAYVAGDETGYEAEREAWGPYQRPSSPDALANDGYLGDESGGGLAMSRKHAKDKQIQDIDPNFPSSTSEHQLNSRGNSHPNPGEYNDIVTNMERMGIKTANNGRQRASYYGQSTAHLSDPASAGSSGYEDKIREDESILTNFFPLTSKKKTEVDPLVSSGAPFSANLAKSSLKTELKFTPEDDAQLEDLKEKKDLSWKENEEFFGWPPETFQVRYSTKLEPGTQIIEGTIPKRPWSLNDDRELARLVIEHGPRWNFVSRELGKRSPEDCEQRYFDLYRPRGELRDDESSILQSSMSHKYGLRAEERLNQDFHNNFHKPSRYRCQICTYDSKYESSCKKHMEEVHGLDDALANNNRGHSDHAASPSVAGEDVGRNENMTPDTHDTFLTRNIDDSDYVSTPGEYRLVSVPGSVTGGSPVDDDWGGSWGTASKKDKKRKEGKSGEEPNKERGYSVHSRRSSNSQDRVSHAASGISVSMMDAADRAYLIANNDVTQTMNSLETSILDVSAMASAIEANAYVPPSFVSTTRGEDEISVVDSTHSTMSIASIGSVFSLLSGFTGSSASSLHSSRDVIERLVVLFLEDETIRPACSKALETISRERFERNLRRLLKSFAVALRQEAESEAQRDTARFVLHRATNSAHLICNKLQQTHKPKQTIVVEDEIEEPFEESESDRSENFDSLQHLEAFLKESNAMDALRKSLIEFVEQNTPTIAINNTKSCSADDPEATAEDDLVKLNDAVPSAEGSTKFEPNVEVKGSGMDNENPKSKLSHYKFNTAAALTWIAAPVHLPFNFINATRMDGSIHKFRNMTYIKSLRSLLVKLDLARPPIKLGKKRVEWRCNCGHKIFDDFAETKPGAAERFQLERITKNNQSSSNSSKGTNASIFSSMIVNIRSVLGQANEKPCSTLPVHERVNTCLTSSTANITNTQPQPPKDSLYLLLCYSEGRYATRLLQVDLTSKGAGCDKALFKLLRSNYQSMRGRFMSYLSFRTLISIKFVSFELYRSQLVDVRKQDDIPPPEHTDYRYQPAPPELIPPIGERHMMHLFEHPDHAEDEPICLDRFPKKLKDKLLCRGGSNPGWGLQFVEGWDMKKIWGLVFLLFGMGSLLIGVLWSVYGHSIQDAFTMAGYMVAMATVSMGTIQAFLIS